MCERYYVRQRVCVDDYLARLIDLRVELDMPRGIAAEAATRGRPALVAGARDEWRRDTSPEATAAICAQMVVATTAAQVEPLLRAGEACEAAPDCASFARCAVETERSYVASGAMH